MSKNVAIIGTGDFGRALGLRLLRHGYAITYGSRSPSQHKLTSINPAFKHVTIETITAAIDQSDVIFICIHSSAYVSLTKYREKFRNKIVVDVSNVESGPVNGETSNAEKLAEMLPGALVVKAFNTQSAYKLENSTSGEGNFVYVASNSHEARERVLQIARTCAFNGIDYGDLSSANQLEAMPLELCGNWLIPVIITMVTSALWLLYCFVHYYVNSDKSWHQFAANVINKFYAAEAITLLSLCYIPGSLAAITQMINGTKYKRFPAWLDHWLKSRKQLGLMSLLLAAMHCVLSVGMINSAYYGSMYLTKSAIVPGNTTDDVRIPHDSLMNWRGESVLSTGVLALALMVILGLTSIPAVGNLLNWRQWVFIQSYLGFLSLCLAEAHIMVKSVRGWRRDTFTELISSMSFMSSFLPYVAILLRLFILIPCVSSYVGKIRKGWERAPVDDVRGKSKQNAVGVEEGIYSNGKAGKIHDKVSNGHTNATFTSEM